jgi:hypothetical protein
MIESVYCPRRIIEMFKLRNAFILLALAVLSLTCGCVKKTMTDEKLIVGVQAFLDTPADPADPTLLTPEERAAIVSFEIYRTTVKIKLSEGTNEKMWTPIGTKIVKVFGKVSRDANILSDSYFAELYIPGTYKDKHEDNLYIGAIRMQNSTDRTYPEIGLPRPKK